MVRRWKQQRINDLALSPDGGTVVSVCNEHAIRLFRLADNSEVNRPVPCNALVTLLMLARVETLHFHVWHASILDMQPITSQDSCPMREVYLFSQRVRMPVALLTFC